MNLFTQVNRIPWWEMMCPPSPWGSCLVPSPGCFASLMNRRKRRGPDSLSEFQQWKYQERTNSWKIYWLMWQNVRAKVFIFCVALFLRRQKLKTISTRRKLFTFFLITCCFCKAECMLRVAKVFFFWKDLLHTKVWLGWCNIIGSLFTLYQMVVLA